MWKGCVSVISEEFDGAIVTQEFPLYQVREDIIRPYYLKLLLRTGYFQRAVRAVTTGHSNRRRTQDDDLEALEVFLPPVEVQDRMIEIVTAKEAQRELSHRELEELWRDVDASITGDTDPDDLVQKWRIKEE